MRKTIFTLFTALCITSVLNVAMGQCVITAVPDPTAGYTPTQIVNGSFDQEPWMVFTYNNVTYTTCKDDKNFNSPSDDESGYAKNIVFNGVDGGWNTTDRYFWRSSLFEYTNTNSGTHDYRHNTSIQGTDKYLEMNNYHSCMLYQDLTTYSHDVIRWTLKHAVTTGGDEYQPIRVEIGAPNRDGEGHIINASGWASNLNPQIDLSTKAIYRFNGVTDKDGHTSTLGFGSASDLQYLRLSKSSNGSGWWTAQGIYLIPAGQTVTRFGFISEAATNNMGNLLDDLTFTTIIGGLTASYGANGSIVVCGFWGEGDASKNLIIDINNIHYAVDMTGVTGQHFTVTVPEDCIGGTVTSIAVYHEDYPGADNTISVNQPISVTAADVHAVYDGVHSWGITATVTAPASGYTLTYGTSYNDCNSATSPTFTEPGTHYVYYTVSAPGYTTEKRVATVFIDKSSFPSGVVITPPTPVSGLTYNKTFHTLISAGSATGGYTMVYALSTDGNTAPTDGWSTSLPQAKWAGDYYVWYKVLGDNYHNDSAPAPVGVTISAANLLTLSLTVNNAAWGTIETQSAMYANDFQTGAFVLPEGWTNDATYPWVINEHQLKSGNTGVDNSTSTIQATYDFGHDGLISFRYKISSENNNDKGYFEIDNNAKINGISGNGSWQTGTYAVTAGNHTFRWRYEKNGSTNSNDDAFYIDDIVITENRPDVTTSAQGISGDKFLVTAVPSSDEVHSFVNWTSNNVVVSTEPTYLITLTKDTVLTANFQKDFEGSGTSDDPYRIPTLDAWNTLANKVNSGITYAGKYFLQTANISEVTNMVGIDATGHQFGGTYDGGGDTLSVNLTNNTSETTAPFRYIRGATIKNLHTTGSINTNQKYAGGIVGRAVCDNTIINCSSDVFINSTRSGDGTDAGLVGLIWGDSQNNTRTTLKGCVFTGKLLGSNTDHCGGLVGWCASDQKVLLTIENCLYFPQERTIGTDGSQTLSRGHNLNDITITNSYYSETLGGAQGKQRYSIIGGEGVTVANAGTPTTYYSVSGITSYGTGIKYGEVLYGGSGDIIGLSLSHTDNAGYTFNQYTVTGGGSLSDYTINNPTLTMTAANQVINVKWEADLAWQLGGQTIYPEEGASGYLGFESLCTFPTLINQHNLTVTYSSTPTGSTTVATIDEYGAITFVGTGTTTIKATFAGNDHYAPAEVSYTLTVVAPPTLTLVADGNGSVEVPTPLQEGVLATATTGIYSVFPSAEVTVKARANDDNHITSWSNNATVTGLTIASQTITIGNDNLTLTATFAIDEYRIDSIRTNWTVEFGGISHSVNAYSANDTMGYVMIPVGAEFLIIPSTEQKPLVSKLELIDKTVPTGALNGKFSVSATKQVYFSQGNLQYSKSTSTWSFMEHQYSTVETLNQNVGANYANQDIVSLFGYATSGYNHGSICYQPYSTADTEENYYPYGSSDYSVNLYSSTGKADWGYNAISNGGNTENFGWRTLTNAEWGYLLNASGGGSGRSDSYRFAGGTIHGILGLIIFPDGFNPTATGVSITGANTTEGLDFTVYSDADWDKMEAAGCVFLPAAGYRMITTSASHVGLRGQYWSSTRDNTSTVRCLSFSGPYNDPEMGMSEPGMVSVGGFTRYRFGGSVRLVRDAN